MWIGPSPSKLLRLSIYVEGQSRPIRILLRIPGWLRQRVHSKVTGAQLRSGGMSRSRGTVSPNWPASAPADCNFSEYVSLHLGICPRIISNYLFINHRSLMVYPGSLRMHL